MHSPFPNKIGILGGGQLARMLIQQGQNLGLEMHVLTPLASDPAAQVTRFWLAGDPRHKADLLRFLAEVDLITFESEFLDSPTLQQITKVTKKTILPDPQTMGILQDRLSQKKLLAEFKIPSADFVAIQTMDHLTAAWKEFPQGLVLKKRRFGYDGYGTYLVHTRSQLATLAPVLEQTKDGFIAEALVPFKRELAVIAARSTQDELRFLPLVETFQENHRCLWVKGPLKHPQLKSLSQRIARLLRETNYAGVMAFELFDTGRSLLVNEIAPRVHNSGHYSLEALATDQFALHLKAISGMPLGPTVVRTPGFAMLNLLGASANIPQWTLPPNLSLHWYGKIENRPGRKMGHLTTLDRSPQAALSRLLKAKKEFKL
ncbi:MAG: 5-(carboxyamino)imidazole ribonucleotide synthase [Bdellovibrionales bacterium]|nr:5-(carboxyamino)imidazole ribonucleotide synthase [Bdellovibrionales bacterium]